MNLSPSPLPAGVEPPAQAATTQDDTPTQEIHYFDSFAIGDAKNRFETLLKKAQKNPVAITSRGKPVAVLLCAEEYEHLQRLDDAYWVARAEAAIAENDWMSAEESEALLQEILNEPDED